MVTSWFLWKLYSSGQYFYPCLDFTHLDQHLIRFYKSKSQYLRILKIPSTIYNLSIWSTQIYVRFYIFKKCSSLQDPIGPMLFLIFRRVFFMASGLKLYVFWFYANIFSWDSLHPYFQVALLIALVQIEL